MPDFLPRSGADLLAWVRNFDQILQQDPEHLGISNEQAAHYSDLYLAFAQTYQNAAQPGARCQSLTAAKNVAEKAVRKFSRVFAWQIRASLSIPNAEKILLGVRPPKRKYSRCPRPARAPVMSVAIPFGGRVELSLKDPEIPFRNAIPVGTVGALVEMYAGDQPPGLGYRWTVMGQVTRTMSKRDLPAYLSPGTKVWFRARWYNRAGQHGDWSQPVYAHVGYGQMTVRSLAA